eukprot:2277366-Alexandrium_andersonii.AAC.1
MRGRSVIRGRELRNPDSEVRNLAREPQQRKFPEEHIGADAGAHERQGVPEQVMGADVAGGPLQA